MKKLQVYKRIPGHIQCEYCKKDFLAHEDDNRYDIDITCPHCKETVEEIDCKPSIVGESINLSGEKMWVKTTPEEAMLCTVFKFDDNYACFEFYSDGHIYQKGNCLIVYPTPNDFSCVNPTELKERVIQTES